MIKFWRKFLKVFYLKLKRKKVIDDVIETNVIARK